MYKPFQTCKTVMSIHLCIKESIRSYFEFRHCSGLLSAEWRESRGLCVLTGQWQRIHPFFAASVYTCVCDGGSSIPVVSCGEGCTCLCEGGWGGGVRAWRHLNWVRAISPWSTEAQCMATWFADSVWLGCHPSVPWGPQNLAPVLCLPHNSPVWTHTHTTLGKHSDTCC